MNKEKGFSLFEVLVVLGIVAIIGIISSSAVITTLRGVKRSDSETKVKQNIDYAVTVMERHLRNSRDVVCTSPVRLDYLDYAGVPAYFSVNNANVGGVNIGYVASNSATVRLTGPEVNIVSAVFTCTPPVGDVPSSVTVELIGEDAKATGIEKAEITVTSKIFLRSVL